MNVKYTFFKFLLILNLIFVISACEFFSKRKDSESKSFVLNRVTTLTVVMNKEIPFNKPLPYIIDSCNSKGDNWRLPTTKELDKMYTLQKKRCKKF